MAGVALSRLLQFRRQLTDKGRECIEQNYLLRPAEHAAASLENLCARAKLVKPVVIGLLLKTRKGLLGTLPIFREPAFQLA